MIFWQKKKVIFLKGRISERKSGTHSHREREREADSENENVRGRERVSEIPHALIHPKWPQKSEQGCSEAMSQKLLLLHGFWSPTTWPSSAAFLSTLVGIWTGSRAAGNQTGTDTKCQHTKGQLISLPYKISHCPDAYEQCFYFDVVFL